MNNNDVVEIDLIMIIKKLLLQWKAILIVAVVFGIVGMNVQYAKAVSEAKLAEQEVDIESLLTDDEIDTVETAVSLNQKITDLETYISSSLLMSVDPLDYEQVSLVLTIHASAGTDARDIAALYVTEMQSNEFVEKIIDGMNKKTTVSYVNNIMTVYHEKDESSVDASIANTDQVNLSIIVPKGWNGDKLSEIAQTAAEEIEITNYANQYTASLDYVAVNENSSFELQQKQKSITDSVSTLKTQLSTATSAFSENQTKLYEEKTAVEAEEEVEESGDTEAVAAPQRSKKYFAVGAVVGILLYACIYGCMVMFGNVTSAELVSGANVLATVYMPRDKKKFLAVVFDDKFLKKLLFKKESDIDAKMQQVAQNLEIAMKSRENKEVYIVGSQFAAGELKAILEQKLDSVKLNFVEVEDEESISAFVKEVKTEDAYLIVLEDGMTSKEDAMKLQSIASTGEIQNMGQIVVIE
jgi:hypothetical protein